MTDFEHDDDDSQVNIDRAADVADLITEFSENRGLDGEDADTIVADMIGCMLHWVEQNHPEGTKAALEAVKNGLGQFMQERVVPNDMGPDAHVSIQVSCAGQEWAIDTFANVTVVGTVNLGPLTY